MLATGNKKLILKIGDDRESSFGSKIDVYFNLREGQVYPLGLYGGTEVELTWLCLRKTQKTGRLYCTSTLLTCIRLVKLGRQFGYISRLFHFPYNIIIYIIASGNKVLGNKTIIVTLFFFLFFFLFALCIVVRPLVQTAQEAAYRDDERCLHWSPLYFSIGGHPAQRCLQQSRDSALHP